VNIGISREEITDLIRVVDLNHDGNVDEAEFVAAFEAQLQKEGEYVELMGDLKGVPNPIILDERCADLKARKKYLLERIKEEELDFGEKQQRLEKLNK